MAPTESQIEEACEAAFRNAGELLDEADVLRGNDRCARAYFLAHIACEELGKLPILTEAATSQRMGREVNWDKIRSVLTSHKHKIKRVLFVDSLMGDKTLQEGEREYEQDLKRMRTYLDVKNASLYSFESEGHFQTPSAALNCDFFDTFRGVARGRLRVCEEMYLRPMRDAGGLSRFLDRMSGERQERLTELLEGSDLAAAFQRYRETGDDSEVTSLFLQALE
jgi:AbiV family abortive infection protein